MLTLRERERRAYIEGRVEDAALLGRAMAAADLEDELDEASERVQDLEAELREARARIAELEDD